MTDTVSLKGCRIGIDVGGTCTEESVRLYGLRVLRTGEPVLLRVRPGEPSTVEGLLRVAAKAGFDVKRTGDHEIDLVIAH